MFKNSIKLISSDLEEEKKILGLKKSINRADFYKSTELNLNATVEFKTRKINYKNQKYAKIKDTDFFIIRTYESTDDFIYLVLSESDLKNTIKIVKKENIRNSDGTYILEDESDFEVDAHITFRNASYTETNNNIKTKTVQNAIIKVRYNTDIDLHDTIKIDDRTFNILSINNLHNLGCWKEIIAEEVV